MNCEEITGDRLTVYEQELLWPFARLVSISSNFLLGVITGSANDSVYFYTFLCSVVCHLCVICLSIITFMLPALLKPFDEFRSHLLGTLVWEFLNV